MGKTKKSLKNRNITLGKKGNNQTSQVEKYRKTLDLTKNYLIMVTLKGYLEKKSIKKLINIFIGPIL